MFLTCDALRWQQRQDPVRIPLVQAVQQPDKIAIPSNDFAASPRARNLVIVVLKHEHAFLFGKQCHDDTLLQRATRPAATKCPAQVRIGPWLASFSAAVAWWPERIGCLVGASVCSKKVASPSLPRRLCRCEGARAGRGRRLDSRSGRESGSRAAWGRHRRLLVRVVPVAIYGWTAIARLVAIRLGGLGRMIVALV